MNQEVLFAKKLQEVRSLAKGQGNCVSEEQVQDAFAELELSGEQLQLVYDYLLKHKIGLGQPLDPDDYLTEEEKDYLQGYLDEIAALPGYSEGEVLAHTLSAMAGDLNAQQLLVQVYLKDVAEIAKLYVGQGAFLEDLIGEGNLALSFGVGMLGSLEKPEEARGMLAKMIMDAMEDHIAENVQSKKADQKAEDHVNKVADAARALSEELRRKVTVAELAKESGLSESRIREAMRISGFQIEEIESE